MREDLGRFVQDVQFEKIPIKDLVINTDRQRRLSSVSFSDRIDPYGIEPVKVIRRNGINYVFDGQRTVELISRASGSGEILVWCMVYNGAHRRAEDDFFIRRQKQNMALTPYEIFMENIKAGNEPQLTIRALVESYGLAVGGSGRKSGCIYAVSALEYIYYKYGCNVLNQTLGVVTSAWGGDASSLSSGMLKGVAKLLACYSERLNVETLASRLGQTPAEEIVREAKACRKGRHEFAEALLRHYNNLSRYPLNRYRLYSVRAACGLDDAGEASEGDG